MENRKKNDPRTAGQHQVNRLFGFEVLDQDRESIGKIENIWVDSTGQPAFFGVQTGWLFGKIHVVPAHQAAVNYENRRICLPHSQEKVKDAPSFDPSEDLSPKQENEVYNYYGLTGTEVRAGTARRENTGGAGAPGRHMEDEQTIQLNEERTEVTKQQKEIGGVRLKKVIRTETVNEPVELTHEEIEIERVPAGEGTGSAPRDLEENEIYIPLRQDEAVVHKETHPKEQVRVGKTTKQERKDISKTVRTEDLEIERENEKREYGT